MDRLLLKLLLLKVTMYSVTQLELYTSISSLGLDGVFSNMSCLSSLDLEVFDSDSCLDQWNSMHNRGFLSFLLGNLHAYTCSSR